MRGKTLRHKPIVVDTQEYVTISTYLYKLINFFFTLTEDVMFVNGTIFLFKSARKIKVVKFEHVKIQTVVHISKILKKVINLYG